jgi:membrane protease YdiL (CAAX protease family)
MQIAKQSPIRNTGTGDGWRPGEAALIVVLAWLGGLLSGATTILFLRPALRLSYYEIRTYGITETLVLCGMVLFPLPIVLRHVRNKPVAEMLESISWNCSDRVFVIAGSVGLGGGFCLSAIKRFLTGQRFAKEEWIYIFAFAVTMLATALIEEVYFRGILYVALRTRIGSSWSIGLVTILFCLMHGRSTYLVIPIAVLLGVIRVYTNSTRASFAAHAMYNLSLIVVMAPIRIYW